MILNHLHASELLSSFTSALKSSQTFVVLTAAKNNPAVDLISVYFTTGKPSEYS